MQPLIHLFIDFENQQPPAEDFVRAQATECQIWLFHGPHQNRFSADVVAAWQPLGDRVRFVQSAKSGKNALDFHIAFALGLTLQEDTAAARDARYLVVSHDNGFDALFVHMRTLGAAVAKAGTIPEALALAASLTADAPTPSPQRKPASAPPPLKVPTPAIGTPDTLAPPPGPSAKRASAKTAKPAPRDTLSHSDVDTVVAGLRARPANRPADREALRRHILPLLRNQVTLKVSDAVIKKLEQRKLIAFDGNKIEYDLPEGKL